jgi:hypothetical protein
MPFLGWYNTHKMNDAIYDDIAIEQACERAFGIRLNIAEVIVREVTVGPTAKATLFRIGQSTHYLYIASSGVLLLADARQIVHRMGLEADEFMPPHGDKLYFERTGREKFKQMFPGKYIMSDDDTRYYESLSRYNPALIRIAQVKGAVYGYLIAAKQWRKYKDYTYAKVKLS